MPGTQPVPGADPRSRPAGAAMADVLGGYLLDLRSHEHGVLDATDPEELHDFRVALRRARSVLWGGHRTFPAEELELFEALVVWLARLTSSARDLDVMAEDLPGLLDDLPEGTRRRGVGALQRELADRQAQAHADLEAAMRGTRYPVLLRRWESLSSGAVVGGGPPGPDADRPAGVVVARVLKKSLKKARRSGAVALGSDDRGDWHRLRKDLKRFRYLLSGFEALYPPGAAKPVERELADLQDVLGKLQDRHVQATLVEQAGLAAGGRSALVAGALSDRLRRAEDKAHRKCHRAFREFDRSDVRAELADLLS